MSQRNSGYKRKKLDGYQTPEWVTRAVCPYLPSYKIWEPAAGEGRMVDELRTKGFSVLSSDIQPRNENGYVSTDFLEVGSWDADSHNPSIVTNPPYTHATEFIEHALKLTEPLGGTVAMLLRTDFDHAKTRRHLFADCPQFVRKVVLTKRIVWFTPKKGEKRKSPSFNHAWYIWSWANKGRREPIISYHFEEESKDGRRQNRTGPGRAVPDPA